MCFITLAVTQPVLDQIKRQGEGVAQIAIHGSSTSLSARIAEARRQNRVALAIGNAIDLYCGDNFAIWGSHQLAGRQQEDFKVLFEFLSRIPGRDVTFACELRLL
jgi:hypothetical protein